MRKVYRPGLIQSVTSSVLGVPYFDQSTRHSTFLPQILWCPSICYQETWHIYHISTTLSNMLTGWNFKFANQISSETMWDVFPVHRTTKPPSATTQEQVLIQPSKSRLHQQMHMPEMICCCDHITGAVLTVRWSFLLTKLLYHLLQFLIG